MKVTDGERKRHGAFGNLMEFRHRCDAMASQGPCLAMTNEGSQPCLQRDKAGAVGLMHLVHAKVTPPLVHFRISQRCLCKGIDFARFGAGFHGNGVSLTSKFFL
jgi:hypothetical protein